MNEETTYEYVGHIGDDQYFTRSDGEFGPVRLINANAIPLVNVMFPVYSYYGKKIDTMSVGPVATKEDIDKIPTVKFPEAWWQHEVVPDPWDMPVNEYTPGMSTTDAAAPLKDVWTCSRCKYTVSKTAQRPIENFCGICGAKILGWRDAKGEIRK